MPSTSQTVVLVTGNLGFTGRHLVRYLADQSPRPQVIGWDCGSGQDPLAAQQLTESLADPVAIRSELEQHRPQYVIHLAGRTPPASDEQLWAANVGLTVNLFEAVKGLDPPPKVVVIGSAAELGSTPDRPVTEDQPCRPIGVYGGTKLAQTLLAQQYHRGERLPVIVARPFNLIGPGMSTELIVGTVCRQLADPRLKQLRLGHLDGYRDFIDIRDAVAAYWALARHGQPGEVYNVCTGRAVRVRDVVEQLIKLADRQVEVITDERRLRRDDLDYSCGDNGRIVADTAWQPRYDLAMTLADTLTSFGGMGGPPL